MIEKVIDGKDGNPKILMETVRMVPRLIPVKFDTKDFAELFVRQHARRDAVFPYRFDGLWRNIDQSPKRRLAFKKHAAPLLKLKRSICETMDVEGNQIIIGKADRKVFSVH